MSEWRATGHEVLTIAEMVEAERLTIAAGTPSLTLMENAGRAVADEICRRWTRRETAVLCGPGNNGGDGYVCARHLKERGWPVTLHTYGDHTKPKGDAATVVKTWTGATQKMTKASVDTARLVVDALFGTGLKTYLKDDADEVRIRLAQRAHAKEDVAVVSIDVPSGVHGDIGALGPPCIIADLTVTFFRKKPAHLSRDNTFEVVVADIGVPDSVLQTIQPKLAENDPDCWLPTPWVAASEHFTGHKYNRGHTFVVSGHLASTGAARLAARAAFRAGCGLVTVLSPPDALAVNAAHLTAIMLQRLDRPHDIERIVNAKKGHRAIAIGPANGVSEATRANVLTALNLGIGTVIDADAMTSFEESPQTLLSALHDRCVLTPHTGEFARLFLSISLSDPLAAARAAAAQAKCVVLLKGPESIIAEPSGRTVVNTNSPGWLATAGSGDVLAGIIASVLAQGERAFEAAAAGAWMHAEAGRRCGRGLIAEDLPERLPEVLRALEIRQARAL